MTGVVLSVITMLVIAWVLAIGPDVVGRFRGKPFTPPGTPIKTLSVTTVITLGITLAITLVLQWTGFTNAQFYRPSDRNYGQHEELGLQPEDVYFNSGDGTRLFGWFIPADGNPLGTVIHLHGSDGNVSSTVRHSYWLSDYGFNVFALDYRGYGRSEGKPSGRGVLDDAVAAIEYVRSRSDVDADRLWLWGQSMGGQLAIVAATEAGTEGIRAVVAEATYGSHRLHVTNKLAQMGPLWLVQWAVWLVTSDRLAAERVVDELSPTPLLIVHGTADRAVLPYLGDRLFAAAADPKEIWRVEGAEHLRVFREAPARERLVAYFKRTLPEPSPSSPDR